MDKQQVIELLEFYQDIDREIQLKIELYGAKQAEREVQNLQALKTSIRRCLDALPHKQKSLVWHHYVKGEKWDKVAMRHWYSVRQINNIVRKALTELGRRMEDEPSVQKFFERKEPDHTS